MTTSAYMSDVKVEIAFTSKFSTPLASMVWTDVSPWVELSAGISIGFGRSDEQSQADANTLSLTLDNSDGRFTPDRAASPYFPNVRLYRPIRVTATPPGGTPSVRFVGYINQWPVEWSGTDSYAMANVTASSRLARLALTDQRRSAVEEAFLLDGPIAYYTLGDPAEAAAASDSSGRTSVPANRFGKAPLVVFGSATGPTGDDLTAAQFFGGQSLRATPSTPYVATGGDFAIAFFIRASALMGSNTIATFGNSSLSILPDGTMDLTLRGSGGSSTLLTNTIGVPNPADGRTRHVAFRVDMTGASGLATAYVDGVNAGSAPVSSPAFAFDDLRIGASFTGVLAHFALYNQAVIPARLMSQASSSNGYAEESSSDRLVRYAAWVGIPAVETLTSQLKHQNVAVDTKDKGVVELMRQLEVTESAVLFDTRTGLLALSAESIRYGAVPAFTLDMAAQDVGADFAPQHDPSALLNDCTVTRVGGTPSARAVDWSSRDEFGVATGSYEVTSTDDDLPFQLASWQVNRYSQPKTRVPAITVNVTEQVGKSPSPGDLLSAQINTLVRVANQPSQAQSLTASYFVEGYTEIIGVESHVISFNVSPAEPFTKVFILDDPIRGALDGSYVLGL